MGEPDSAFAPLTVATDLRHSEVLRYPTLTAAAEDLGLRQAVLTLQIARLEEDLGGALIERP